MPTANPIRFSMFSLTSASLSAKGLLTPLEHPPKMSNEAEKKKNNLEGVEQNTFIVLFYSSKGHLRNTNLVGVQI